MNKEDYKIEKIRKAFSNPYALIEAKKKWGNCPEKEEVEE